MAGLLDFNDPQSAGLMALASGLLSASGPSRMPVSLGQAFGQGSMQALDAMRQAQEAQDMRKHREQQAAMQALQMQHLQSQMANEAEMKPLQVQQLKQQMAEHAANMEFANSLLPMLATLRGGQRQALMPYTDQVKPTDVGGKAFGGIQGFSSPDEYFRMVAAIPDENKTDKLAAYEAGFRQWPETRPVMQQQAQGGDPRDLGTLGVMMAARGLKGGSEMMKLADLYKPEEFKGGSTYRMPDGTERYIPVLKEGQMPDGRGGMTAIPGFFDFQRQNALATVDPVARTRAMYETGIDPTGGQLAGIAGGGGASGMSPKDAAAARLGAVTGANDDWIKNSYRPVLEAAKSADNMLTSIAAIRNTNLNTGWGTETKAAVASALEGLGIAPEKAKMYASNAQVFQSQASTRLWEVLNNAKGPQTEGDADRAKQTFAALKNTPRANEFILDLAEATARREKLKSQFYAEAMPVARDMGDLTAVDRKWSQIQRSVWNDPIMAKWKGSK